MLNKFKSPVFYWIHSHVSKELFVRRNKNEHPPPTISDSELWDEYYMDCDAFKYTRTLGTSMLCRALHLAIDDSVKIKTTYLTNKTPVSGAIKSGGVVSYVQLGPTSMSIGNMREFLKSHDSVTYASDIDSGMPPPLKRQRLVKLIRQMI